MFLRLLLAALALALQLVAQAGPFDAKTTRKIIDRAREGVSQDLYVVLDTKDIDDATQAQRLSKGLPFIDKQIMEESTRRTAELKRNVFPGGRLGRNSVVRDQSIVGLLLVRVPDLPALEELLAHPRVKYVQEPPVDSPTLYQSLPLIGLPVPYTSGETDRGKGYRVVVLDSGADLSSPWWSYGKQGCGLPGDGGVISSMRPAVGSAGCRVSAAIDFNNRSAKFTDVLGGHGTNVAGIASSVAAGAKIDILNVFDPSTGQTNPSAVEAALNWVLQNRENASGRVAAVNLSFGSGRYSTECAAYPFAPLFDKLRSVGILVVAASGNDAFTDAIISPACAPGVTRVGAVYDANFRGSVIYPACSESDKSRDVVPCFSNSSSLVSMLAPGATICFAGSSISLCYDGTSQAAPHVSGAAAVLNAAFPGDGPDVLLSRLRSSGRSIQDFRNGVTRPRLDVQAALATANVASSGEGSTNATTLVATVVATMFMR